MKFMKLFSSVTAACLLAIIFPTSAYADLQEIVDDYCIEVVLASEEAGDELREASLDLQDCYNEYTDCLGGIIE